MTNEGKIWVLQHLGRKQHVPITSLNHSSNGFLAIQVCCCMLLCVFALRLTVANLPTLGRILQNVNTWFDAYRLSVDVFSDPPIMVVWNARHLSHASELDRMHGKPLPGGSILMGKGGPAAVTRDLFAFQFGLCAALYELRGFVAAGVKSSPPVFTAALCVTMVRRKLTRRPALSRTYPATTSRHKVPTSWWCRCMTRPTHHQQRHASGAQAGVARDGFKLCCQ